MKNAIDVMFNTPDWTIPIGAIKLVSRIEQKYNDGRYYFVIGDSLNINEGAGLIRSELYETREIAEAAREDLLKRMQYFYEK